MKPWLLITGIGIILLLLGLWLYLLFFGAPDTEDLFGGFNFGDTSEEIVPLPPATPEVTASTTPARLRQLTTRVVVGYSESLATTTLNPFVLFAEGGTGHIYSVDIITGEETRISNITVAGATEAVFSPDQSRVVIQSGFGQNRTLLSISLLDTTTLELPPSVGAFAFNQSGELLYASSNNNTVVAQSYNFRSNTSRNLFTIPFKEATIKWGTGPDATHHFYPKSASRLEGTLYTGTNSGVINRTPLSGYGLSTVNNSIFTIFAIQANNEYRTFIYNQFENSSQMLGVGFIPEKCVFLNEIQTYTICAQSSLGTYDLSIPDQWYMGVASFTDELWLTNLTNSETILLTETAVATGRDLDIISLQTNNTDERLYFINKNDRALWLYELVE